MVRSFNFESAVLFLTLQAACGFSSIGRSVRRVPSAVRDSKNSHDDRSERPVGDDDSQTGNGACNRRDAIRKSGLAVASSMGLSSILSPASASAIGIPFLTPEDAAPYKTSKRATSYFVDSTIPPTMIPLKGSTERGMLQQIASGMGTQKSALKDESLTLNNMMNKGVFGTISNVRNLVGKGEPVITKDHTFVVMGMDNRDGDGEASKDMELAMRLLGDMIGPRVQKDLPTAIGLSWLPVDAQPLLDAFAANRMDQTALLQTLTENKIEFPRFELMRILEFSRRNGNRVSLLALKPNAEDLITAKNQGLQNIPEGRRAVYVADVQGFIEQTTDPTFKLYTEKSMIKQLGAILQRNETASAAEEDPANFFAQKILEDEAIATGCARWAVLRPRSMVVVLSPFEDTRFMGGAIRRLPRICKFMNPACNVDEECVTSILLNPTARDTLSQSRFLRLEIGTAPENLEYQTKLADYVWFSTMPKVNMLPRNMNPI